MRTRLLLALAGLAIAGLAQAYPTLVGPTGAVALPTSELTSTFDVAADWYDTDVDTTIPTRIVWGLGNNVELGGLWAFNDFSDLWGVNAKFGFGVGRFTGLALGANYLRGQDVDVHAEQAYLVHTMMLSKPDAATTFKGTLGVNWTRISVADEDEDGLRYFASAQVGFADRFAILAEFQTELERLGDADPLSSIALRAQLAPNFAAQVGYTNAGFFPFGSVGFNGADEHNLFAGLVFGSGIQMLPGTEPDNAGMCPF